MINYIIQIVVFQLVFLLIYDVFLQKETFFSKNRIYLLSTMVLSLLLPKIKISILQEYTSNYDVLLNEIVLNPQKIIEKTQNYQYNYMNFVFWIGVLIFTILFLVKIFKLIKILLQNDILRKDNYKLVNLSGTSKAFSFFNYIFLGDKIPNDRKSKIIQHELVHCNEKHTYDLLFFEVLKIIMWFNPLVYLYQKRIVLVHEFIADEIVGKQTKDDYIKNLLSEVFEVENFSFVNQFYKESLIKKRVIMLTKKKSKAVKLSKYALLIPVLVGMLVYTSCDKKNTKPKEPKQEVITSENDVMPYGMVTKKPNFLDREEYKSDDFGKNIRQFVAKNFNPKVVDGLGLENGVKRVMTQFTINKNGDIENIKVRAPHQKLKEETIRIMKLLPKCSSAESNGKKVSVIYTLPITFNIE